MTVSELKVIREGVIRSTNGTYFCLNSMRTKRYTHKIIKYVQKRMGLQKVNYLVELSNIYIYNNSIGF
jgi:hypothetical protein